MLKLGTVLESPQTGERLIIRSTAESSNGELFQAELIAQPGSYVVRSHLHPSQEESFVILEGTYGFRIGGALWRAGVVAVAYGLVLVATIAAIALPAVLRHR